MRRGWPSQRGKEARARSTKRGGRTRVVARQDHRRVQVAVADRTAEQLLDAVQLRQRFPVPNLVLVHGVASVCAAFFAPNSGQNFWLSTDPTSDASPLSLSCQPHNGVHWTHSTLSSTSTNETTSAPGSIRFQSSSWPRCWTDRTALGTSQQSTTFPTFSQKTPRPTSWTRSVASPRTPPPSPRTPSRRRRPLSCPAPLPARTD